MMNDVIKQAAAFAKEHGIAWATFVAVFAFAVTSPAAQKSLDQSARNQLAPTTAAFAQPSGVGERDSAKFFLDLSHTLRQQQRPSD